ncbi:MAG: hypothetical protein K2J77_07905 [Oscillospiraceae bacterium]|nr:hypothetical protein [Oscillospiraceae bacterium]
MLKIKLAVVLCALLLLIAGCAAKDDFADYSVTEHPQIEYLSAETEFAEYDGNAEAIYVFLTNDRDEYFHFDYYWWLEKEVDGEWRAIRFIQDRALDLVDYSMPRGTVSIWCELKDNVKQPLLPGHYRLWVGGDHGRVSAEFDVK